MRKLICMMGMLTLIATLVGCVNQTTYEYEATMKHVSVAESALSEKPQMIKTTGYIQPNQMMPHIFTNTGVLETLEVKTGDFVYVGDVLATSVGPGGIENLVAQVDGYVAQISLRKDDLVSPEKGSIVIVDEVLKVHYGITLNEALSIENSEEVETNIVINNERIQVFETQMSFFLNPQTQMYNVESEVIRSGMLPIGQRVDVEITLDSVTGIWLPLLWLQSDGHDYLNIVDSEGIIQKRYVTWHDLYKEWVRVEGIEPGEKIVIDGVGLREGQRVVIEEAEDETLD